MSTHVGLVTVSSIRVLALPLLVLLAVRPGYPQVQATGESCSRDTLLLYDAPPISILPAEDRAGIIHVLLPELRASGLSTGFNRQQITPQHLSSSLRFRELANKGDGERVLAVIFRDPSLCGSHGQCSAYLLAIDKEGVRSLKRNDEHLGMSVGGAWGVAVESRSDSLYPDLLFLASISSEETAVGCYRWKAHAYESGCDVPCARILAHPGHE